MENSCRLIDANALMDVIRQHEYSLATKQGSVDFGMFTIGIQQAVDEQPTVDAVEVCRCKDCKHYNVYRLECHNGHMNGYIGIDGFCSYGERKDNDI